MGVTLSSVTATQATLQLTLTNSSTAPITSSYITDLGFNLSTPISAATATSTNAAAWANNASLNQTIPGSGGNLVNVCYSTNAGCQGPGSSASVSIGETATWTSVLTFTTPLTASQLANFSLTLDNFSIKYQGINSTGSSTTGYSAENFSGVPGTSTPEPATSLLLGAGLLTAGVIRRKLRS